MTEIILSNKKHGMLVLLLTIVLYILAVLGTIFFADEAQIAPLVLCILYLSLGWLPLLGLKVLGPQEALVLTLFGNYIGTLKGEGFYFVNPFCTAVNPAAKTQLSQSGDVDSAKGSKVLAALGGSSVSLPKEAVTKKISLKIMTLSNARQKINDCLGNPVEIGIAVTWRVVDTGKAVFDVDNYKEFLSLQCDSALRNIVRLYPYDVSPGVDTTGDGVPDEGSLRGVQRRGGRPHSGGNSGQGPGGRSGDLRGADHPPGLRLGDCRRHAAASAGLRHHRRPEDDCGGRRGHRGNGPGASEPERCGGAG